MYVEGYTAWSVTNPKKNTIVASVGKSLVARMYQAFLVLLVIKSYNVNLLLVAIISLDLFFLFVSLHIFIIVFLRLFVCEFNTRK